MVKEIVVSAVVIRNDAGQVLSVRKRGTDQFMFPGGKPEPGETAVEAGVREVEEELGITLLASNLTFLGEFTARAANEPGQTVRASVFEHPFVEVQDPQSEIAELKWIEPTSREPNIAPLLCDAVLPQLPRRLRLVAVFTGSALGSTPAYSDAAHQLAVAAQGIDLVYGGGKVGLMGVVADAFLEQGLKVFGVIPDALVSKELGHSGLTSLEVVPTMHARKQRMAELADGFIALPGGAGTLEELFEVWTWQQLGIHSKPVALFDVDGFWQPLLDMLEQMTQRGFIKRSFFESLIVSDDASALLQAMSRWQPPAPKWS